MYTLLLLLFLSLSTQSAYVGTGSGGDQGVWAVDGAYGDEGCHLDPNGGCASAFGSNVDAGPRMDDNG
jgi:hypothetical protein